MAGRAEQPLTIEVAVEAAGERDPDAIYIDFYASADTQITEADFYLGQASVALSMNSWTMVTLHGTLPEDIPAGTYYVGWIIDPENTNDETNEANNTAFNRSSRLTVVGASRAVLYVDVNARGSNDGSSWTDAFHYLQDALAKAIPGCEIRVADGVYTPDRGAGVTRGDRRATFALRSGVTIAGGYAGGGETEPDARDITTRWTILSGDLNGDDLAIADPCMLWVDVSRVDNSRHVVTALDADRTAVLDGLRITGGCADGWSDAAGTPPDSQGAGLYISGGGPRLKRCVFSGNWTSAEGGAIYATDSSLELISCTLWGNAAGSSPGEHRGAGGAVSVAKGSLGMVNCSLNGNFSSGSGGALVVGPGSDVSAVNCCFHANRAAVQAGAIYALDSQASLVNCTLAYNRQDANPWAVVPEGQGELHIANCILWNHGQEIAGMEGSRVTVAYSDVRGGWPGVGNLDGDPQFVNPNGPDGLACTADDDLRLGWGSPCLDAGDTNAIPKDATDLDGDRNILEPLPLDRGGNPRVTGDAVDIGAYEAPPPADQASSG